MGNFFSDSLTDTLNLKNYVNQPGDVNAAYYYVDYVCVSKDSLWQATTGLRPEEFKEEFNIYPNPASNHLKIENIKLNSTITIFNFLGEKLKQLTSEGFSLDINIEKFKPGVYFIHTSYGLTRKFIKLLYEAFTWNFHFFIFYKCRRAKFGSKPQFLKLYDLSE
jgi:hypothetical protein